MAKKPTKKEQFAALEELTLKLRSDNLNLTESLRNSAERTQQLRQQVADADREYSEEVLRADGIAAELRQLTSTFRGVTAQHFIELRNLKEANYKTNVQLALLSIAFGFCIAFLIWS